VERRRVRMRTHRGGQKTGGNEDRKGGGKRRSWKRIYMIGHNTGGNEERTGGGKKER